MLCVKVDVGFSTITPGNTAEMMGLMSALANDCRSIEAQIELLRTMLVD